MTHSWIAVGALWCAVSIAAGAFGAHGLKARLDADALALWETAARYFMYAGFGLMAIGLAASREAVRGTGAAGVSLLIGSLIFSGTVAVLALGGPRWFGAITPIGGLLLTVGFVLFGWNALKI